MCTNCAEAGGQGETGRCLPLVFLTQSRFWSLCSHTRDLRHDRQYCMMLSKRSLGRHDELLACSDVYVDRQHQCLHRTQEDPRSGECGLYWFVRCASRSITCSMTYLASFVPSCMRLPLVPGRADEAIWLALADVSLVRVPFTIVRQSESIGQAGWSTCWGLTWAHAAPVSPPSSDTFKISSGNH